MIHFAYPYILWLLLVLLPLFYSYLRRDNYGKIKIPTTNPLAALTTPIYVKLGKHLAFILRAITIVLVIVAAAGPQRTAGQGTHKTAGLDLMLIIDTSGSMRALDFLASDGKRKNRLAVVREVIADFITARSDDRIGMIVFGDEAYTQAPLTSDHDVLLEFLSQVEIGMAGENTAIGDAIGVATNRLKDVDAKNKIAILLTDGENTAGRLNPLMASQAAASYGIKIYTVGIGSNEPVPIPHRGRLIYHQVPLDEKILRKIATATAGEYFKATDTDTLQNIYRTIDKLEKTEKELKIWYEYEKLYGYFLWSALLLFFLENLLGLTRFKRLPMAKELH